VKEGRGVVIPKANGEPHDHITEVAQATQRVKKTIIGIKGSLRESALDENEVDRELLTSKLSELSLLLDSLPEGM
jgi:hypothetical protein